MTYGCTLNEVHSRTLDLIMRSKSRPILAASNDVYTQISGRSGSYLSPHESSDIIHEIEFFTTKRDLQSLKIAQRKIAAWLHSKDRVRIIFDDEPDKFYFGKVDGTVDFEQFATSGVLTVSFRCQPFAQMVISTASDPTWEDADFPWCIDMPWVMADAYRFTATDAASFTFYHPGTQEVGQNSPQGSQFNVVVTGSWTNLSLSLNGKTLSYTEPGSGTLVINNVDMEVNYDGISNPDTIDNQCSVVVTGAWTNLSLTVNDKTIGYNETNSGTFIVDSSEMETAPDGINKLDALSGDIDSFLSVVPGENTIGITGTDLNVTVTLDLVPLWL